MTTNLLEGLNPAQREAVEHAEGPLLIVAGPGSGKTRVIVHQVAHLVRSGGVSPRRIGVVTFTNKAARELRERLGRLLGPHVAPEVTAGTFHALCARILRQHGEAIGLDRGFTIYDRDDQLSILKRAFERANVDSKRFAHAAVLGAISGAKAQLEDAEAFRSRVHSYFEEVVLRIYEEYQSLLHQNQAVDFDDLLMRTHYLFSHHDDVLDRYQERYLHLLVDEFQDTNLAQYALARQLSGRWRNICVVGDPDQSIYSWRHADIRNILSFQHHFPDARTVMLEENYRSTESILGAAQGVIAGNRARVEKRLVAMAPGGGLVQVHEAYDETEEATWVLQEIERLRKQGGAKYGDCAVAYRVNAQSRAFEEACLRYGIPYRLVGALRFYQRREIKDVMAYLRILQNPADDVSMARVLNVPPRGIGQRTVDEITRWARSMEVSLREALVLLAAEPDRETPIPRTGRAALERVALMLDELDDASRTMGVPDLLDRVTARTGYHAYVLQEAEGGEERWDNVSELRSVAADFAGVPPPEGLEAFLEQISLVSETDNVDEQLDGITLITLHQAKGLEFPAVFMVGMEEGLLPHVRSLDDPDEMEEERRLCYVGMTRAKQHLYLVRAFRRTVFGRSATGVASRFLQDIPPHLVASPGAERGPRRASPPNRPATGTVTGGSDSPTFRVAGARWADRPPPTEQTQGPPFHAGDRVRHGKFGEGVVVSCTVSAGDHEVAVAFKDGGVKRLLHSMAGLEKVARRGSLGSD